MADESTESSDTGGGEGEDSGSVLFKLAVTVGLVLLAIPGLVFEPGPLSEIGVGLALLKMWSGNKPPEEAAEEAATA